ncbi:hypothetical protein B0H14DRAFT_2564281 [Mycena olivaceomarginata]|nr:hypothetical protein B0H14DRAFT_2564281 [Mycena olivaceomarginata]
MKLQQITSGRTLWLNGGGGVHWRELQVQGRESRLNSDIGQARIFEIQERLLTIFHSKCRERAGEGFDIDAGVDTMKPPEFLPGRWANPLTFLDPLRCPFRLYLLPPPTVESGAHLPASHTLLMVVTSYDRHRTVRASSRLPCAALLPREKFFITRVCPHGSRHTAENLGGGMNVRNNPPSADFACLPQFLSPTHPSQPAIAPRRFKVPQPETTHFVIACPKSAGCSGHFCTNRAGNSGRNWICTMVQYAGEILNLRQKLRCAHFRPGRRNEYGPYTSALTSEPQRTRSCPSTRDETLSGRHRLNRFRAPAQPNLPVAVGFPAPAADAVDLDARRAREADDGRDAARSTLKGGTGVWSVRSGKQTYSSVPAQW